MAKLRLLNCLKKHEKGVQITVSSADLFSNDRGLKYIGMRDLFLVPF